MDTVGHINILGSLDVALTQKTLKTIQPQGTND